MDTTTPADVADGTVLHVGVIEWGSDYADRYPATVVARTLGEARVRLAPAVFRFFDDAGHQEPRMVQFRTDHGTLPTTPDAAEVWWDALAEYDLPLFPAFSPATL